MNFPEFAATGHAENYLKEVNCVFDKWTASSNDSAVNDPGGGDADCGDADLEESDADSDTEVIPDSGLH